MQLLAEPLEVVAAQQLEQPPARSPQPIGTGTGGTIIGEMDIAGIVLAAAGLIASHRATADKHVLSSWSAMPTTGQHNSANCAVAPSSNSA